MRMYDIIEAKRDGRTLSDEQIRFFVDGYVKHEIPDYQISALLMAIFLRGMNEDEIVSLTMHMMYSGDIVDLSSLPGPTLDKHSTGGVGDKTSLALVPMLAAMDPGVYVAKMSGRGLGHTGGTLDKLESIPGFTVQLDTKQFLSTVRAHGGAIVGQTAHLVPADQLIYALRDVTATVDSIPLIASSIMSKKLASGAGNILLDVKVGSGAFMKTVDSAIKLAQTMVMIGTRMGRNVQALITNMDRPLGCAIGNALEVAEVAATLQGKGPQDLTDEAVLLAADLLALTGRIDNVQAQKRARQVIDDGSALAKFAEIITAQGGDPKVLYHPELMGTAPLAHEVRAPFDGFMGHMNTHDIGVSCAQLGAGRLELGDTIDHTAGIMLYKNFGQPIFEGEVIARLYASQPHLLAEGSAMFERAITCTRDQPEPEPLLYATVTKEGVTLS